MNLGALSAAKVKKPKPPTFEEKIAAVPVSPVFDSRVAKIALVVVGSAAAFYVFNRWVK